jgi:hypothetical protein
MTVKTPKIKVPKAPKMPKGWDKAMKDAEKAAKKAQADADKTC